MHHNCVSNLLCLVVLPVVPRCCAVQVGKGTINAVTAAAVVAAGAPQPQATPVRPGVIAATKMRVHSWLRGACCMCRARDDTNW